LQLIVDEARVWSHGNREGGGGRRAAPVTKLLDCSELFLVAGRVPLHMMPDGRRLSVEVCVCVYVQVFLWVKPEGCPHACRCPPAP
jgi:hypothetical protein